MLQYVINTFMKIKEHGIKLIWVMSVHLSNSGNQNSYL